MIKKIYIYISIFFFFVFVCILSFWSNLSNDRIKGFLEYHITKNLNSGYSLSVKSLDKGLSYIQLNEIILKNKKGISILKIDEAIIEFPLFQVLFLQKIRLLAKLYAGTVTGDIDLIGEKEIVLLGKNIEFNQNTYIRRTDIIANNPSISFNLKSNWKSLFKKYVPCNCSFNIKNLILNGKNTIIKFQLLPKKINFSSINIHLKTINQNKIRTTIDYTGDLSGEVVGSIFVNFKKFIHSTLDLKIKLVLKELFKKEMGILESFIRAYQINPLHYQLQLSGRVSFPKAKKI